MAGIEFKDVAQLLSCRDFALAEMAMDRRQQRARCPFHAGAERFNLQFFDDGRCYCHVCHKSGDVVTLAAAVWGLPQGEAARQLNDVFNLGLAAERMTAQDREQRQREREAEAQRREAAKRAEALAWGKAADAIREAETRLEGVTIKDADKPATWANVARLARAQDQWSAMWAAQACRG